MDGEHITIKPDIGNRAIEASGESFLDKHASLKKLFRAAGTIIVGTVGGGVAGTALAADVSGGANILIPLCASAGFLIATYYAIKNLREPGLT